MKRPILLAALPLIAVLSGFVSRPVQDERSWTFTYKKDAVERYRTYIKITARQADDSGDIKIGTRSESHHTITDVSPEGVAQWDQVDDKAEATLNGMPIPDKGGEKKPVKITADKNGLWLKRVNPAADPFDRSEKSLPAYQATPIPDRPVKIGDSWKTEYPNPILKNKTIVATSTFVAVEPMLGRDAVKIKMTADFPSSFGAPENEIVHLEKTYWLDAKTYELLRVRLISKNPLLPFPAAKVESEALVSRIVPGVNDKEDPEGEAMLASLKAKPAETK